MKVRTLTSSEYFVLAPLLQKQGKHYGETQIQTVLEYLVTANTNHHDSVFAFVAESDEGDILGYLLVLNMIHPLLPSESAKSHEMAMYATKGCGSLLLEAWEKLAKERNIYTLVLHCDEDSKRFDRLYGAKGFRRSASITYQKELS